MKVDIGKMVDYESLEKALQEAAIELGLDMSVKEEVEEEYELGPPLKKNEKYLWTRITLKRDNLVMTELNIYRQYPIDSFTMRTGQLYGTASEEEIKQYLDILRTNLDNELMKDRTKK